MWTKQTRLWRFILCFLLAVGTLTCTAAGEEEEVPSESQCRPYIEKALKGLEEAHSGSIENNDSGEEGVENETKEDSAEETGDVEDSEEDSPSIEVADEPYVGQETAEALTAEADDDTNENSKEDDDDGADDDGDSKEVSADDEAGEESAEDQDDEKDGDDDGSQEEGDEEKEDVSDEKADDKSAEVEGSETADADDDGDESEEAVEKDDSGKHADDDSEEDTKEDSDTGAKDDEDSDEDKNETAEQQDDDKSEESESIDDDGENKSGEDNEKSGEDADDDDHDKDDNKSEEASDKSKEDDDDDKSADDDKSDEKDDEDDDEDNLKESDETDEDDSSEGAPEEDLLKVRDIPENLRSRDHIVKILRLDEEASEAELTIERSAEIVLRDLKRLYELSIKPLETLYKYRDLSNRHFGDPEIFSKPLVLFMGPWSGGKSSLVNYLTGIEFTEWSLRTGAEPSPAYFNILMHGKEPEVLDGTQLAADWTFSGLQKFGQGLEERLRGLRYPSKLLEKVNIVEIPGILEVRKQVSRVFPFNDACQWFIDRADIIFLVYDPSKLDVGPETEAILDQLKGRESQTRILLNKADTVKPEELMRVQSALIWNISPLMSSAQPPGMYTVSLWSMPYDQSAPVRLLQAQERELLKDLRSAIDRRIENKISSARRFAVRVRNHAKMVDCYLTTFYNHKTIFGNKKLIAEAIIENPQNYHIYEGLSTLTNISRYDLPDPETYRDFFRLNPIYEFQQLSATCTYFRGCPINKLDVAIAYDFPELVGKYKKMVETATPQGMPKS